MKKSLKIIAVAGVLAAVVTAAIAGDWVCQLDNMDMHWTGASRSEYGKLLKEYRCPNGHTAWVVDR